MDNLFENHRVNVLPQHVQQEPVPHLCLLDDDVDALLLHQPEPDVEQIGLKNESRLRLFQGLNSIIHIASLW